MNSPHILVIEDDQELAILTRDYLTNHGYRVSVERDGLQAVQRIVSEQPALVILDIMLPGKDGFAICREARYHYQNPILMLTARDEDLDQLLGLELGADDYVTKPVQPRLLLARIHALLRRVTPQGATGIMHFDTLRIDLHGRAVTLQDQPVELTTAEFNLLALLAHHAGVILSRDDILQHLRGIDYDGSDRSIDLRISRLRRKLQGCSFIKTVRGAGYLFTGNTSS